MSANTSPTHYPEDAFMTDAGFKVSINQKMRVPDKISFSTETNGFTQPPWVKDTINMQVPERILVTAARPSTETYRSTSTFPTEVRPTTPQKNLTYDNFMTTSDADGEEAEYIPVIKTGKKIIHNLNDSNLTIPYRESTPPLGGAGDSLTPAEEVLHLRKQMAKLNRRVMALELENINRLQKEKIFVGLGIAYFLLKVVIWMSRD